MRKELSSLDLKFLLPELRSLVGGIIKKAWQKDKQIRIEIFVPSKGTAQLIFEPGRIFVTQYKRKAPKVPEPFAMAIRKRLSGQKILNIRQPAFERIVEFETENNILIFELFSKGNVILCDKEYKIIFPLEVQTWKDRKIAPKHKYSYPPAVADPFKLKFEQFLSLLKSSQKELVRFLATNLSLSGLYAEEVCARAGVDKKKICSLLSEAEAQTIFKTIHDLTKNPSPRIIFENKEMIDVVPIELEIYKQKRYQKFNSFMAALDEYFIHLEIGAEELLKKARLRAEKDKLLHILSEQQAALEKWKRVEHNARKCAEAIYANYSLINEILSAIFSARRAGLEWPAIKKETKKFTQVKEILERKGKIILEIKGTQIEIDFRKSAQENLNAYFERAKRAKRKLEAIKQAMVELRKKIKQVEKQTIEKRKLQKRRRGKWFEKFRWMLTSDDFLVIAGRDATQNEILFKKHLEPNDIVLHADISGAPLTIIKSQGKPITANAIHEAGEFAAAYSAAWKAGLASIDVYWIKPEQISKTAPSGQYLPKGSFMIRGHKNYLKKIELKIAIGIKFEQNQAIPICGTVQAISKHAKYFITLKPGHSTQAEVAKEIKRRIALKALPKDKEIINEIPIDDIQRLMPSGRSTIIS